MIELLVLSAVVSAVICFKIWLWVNLFKHQAEIDAWIGKKLKAAISRCFK